MSDNTPEQVAFKLLELVAEAEGKQLKPGLNKPVNVDREWLLQTYYECLHVATRHQPLKPKT